MPRLFSGIEIPASVARRLTLVRAGLTGARWIDPENYHVTLRFLGDVDGTTARDFAHGLGDIAASPFELRLDALGSFGGRKPIEEPTNEDFVPQALREDSNTGIHHLPVGKDPA